MSLLSGVRCAAARALCGARFLSASRSAASSEPQFKAMIMLKRKEGISREDFQAWWLGQHRELAQQLPGIKKYAVNLVRVAPGDPEPAYDGVAELWFDKEEDLFEAYKTEIGAAVAEDSLARVCKRDRMLTDEHVFEPPTFRNH